MKTAFKKLFNENTISKGRFLIIEEGLRRGFSFEGLDGDRWVFKVSRNGVGFRYFVVPGDISSRKFKNIDNKDVEVAMMTDVGMIIPKNYGAFDNLADIKALLESTSPSYPVIAKPNRGSLSEGVILNITSNAALLTACGDILKKYKKVIVEQMVFGREFRIVFVDGKYVACNERRSARVFGDGISSIQKLINKRNEEPERGPVDDTRFTNHYIIFDETSQTLLDEKKYTLDIIPKKDEVVVLQQKISAALGSDYIDFTEKMHPAYIEICKRFYDKYKFFLLGFDVITPDITKNPLTVGHAFNEFNIRPYIDLNENCNIGEKQPVSAAIWNAIEARGDEIINKRFLEF